MAELHHYLILSGVLFTIGTAGVLLRRNLITVLLSIEVMLNAVNLTFIAFGHFLGSATGKSSCSLSSPWPPPKRRSGLPSSSRSSGTPRRSIRTRSGS